MGSGSLTFLDLIYFEKKNFKLDKKLGRICGKLPTMKNNYPDRVPRRQSKLKKKSSLPHPLHYIFPKVHGNMASITF